MTAMMMVRPIAVAEAMLTATNIAENDYPLWASPTVYAVGDRVISTTTHKVYERLVAGASGATPGADSHIRTARGKRVKRVTDTAGAVVTYTEIPDSDITNWLEVGPTNRWAAFDASISTQSTRSGTIQFTVTPGKVVNAIGMMGVVGTSVRVQVIDPADGTVYDKTTAMQAPPPESSYYSYCFDPILTRETLVATDLPSYGSAAITVTIDAGAGTAALGAFLVGKSFAFGDDAISGAQVGAKIGINDASKNEYDTFGKLLLLKRGYARRGAFDVLIPNSRLDAVNKALTDARATPTLYIASDRYDATAIYGVYKDFDITIPYANYSQCSLTLNGMD